MNSETVSPMPPRRLRSARKGTSVTPAIGERTSGGLISTSRILKGLVMSFAGASRPAPSGRLLLAPGLRLVLFREDESEMINVRPEFELRRLGADVRHLAPDGPHDVRLQAVGVAGEPLELEVALRVGLRPAAV